MSFEKTLNREYIYKGKIINMRRDEVELASGKKTSREVCEHNGGVAILPVTESGEVVLVSQFRYPFGRELCEAPAGKLEPGEDHLACGIRELSEETGYTAENMQYLGFILPSPGYLTEKIYLYLARGLESGCAHPDEGEELRIIKYDFKEALSMCDSGEINDAKTVALIYRAARLMGIG